MYMGDSSNQIFFFKAEHIRNWHLLPNYCTTFTIIQSFYAACPHIICKCSFLILSAKSLQAVASSSNTNLIPGPVLDLHWSNYTSWPPTGRLSKGPLKINIHSLRSVICFWHYRPCSVSALSLSVLYSSIYPLSQPPYLHLNWVCKHRFFNLCPFAYCFV